MPMPKYDAVTEDNLKQTLEPFVCERMDSTLAPQISNILYQTYGKNGTVQQYNNGVHISIDGISASLTI